MVVSRQKSGEKYLRRHNDESSCSFAAALGILERTKPQCVDCARTDRILLIRWPAKATDIAESDFLWRAEQDAGHSRCAVVVVCADGTVHHPALDTDGSQCAFCDSVEAFPTGQHTADPDGAIRHEAFSIALTTGAHHAAVRPEDIESELPGSVQIQILLSFDGSPFRAFVITRFWTGFRRPAWEPFPVSLAVRCRRSRLAFVRRSRADPST